MNISEIKEFLRNTDDLGEYNPMLDKVISDLIEKLECAEKALNIIYTCLPEYEVKSHKENEMEQEELLAHMINMPRKKALEALNKLRGKL